MSNPTRKFLRRKQQQDHKARLRQVQAERNMMAKQQPAANAPEMEERRFTEAEMELFNSKYAPYQKAAEDLNATLAFLKKQHGIVDGEGWQLGPQGFVRAVAKHQTASKPKAPKGKKEQTPPPAPTSTPSGEGGSDQGNETAVHQNGVVPEKEAAALARPNADRAD